MRSTHDIVIGVDPHKASWTAAVMNTEHHVLAKIRVPTSQDGYQQLQTFTAAWPQATWAVEGAIGLGAPLTARLLDSGATVIDVPAKLSARVRMLDRGHSRKTDEADAVSTAAAAMGNYSLRPVVLDPAAERSHRRLYEYCSDVPPTEMEAAHYAQIRVQQPAELSNR